MRQSLFFLRNQRKLIFLGIQFLCITFVPEENALSFLLACQCLAAAAVALLGIISVLAAILKGFAGEERGFAALFLIWVFLGAIEQPAIVEAAAVYRIYPYSVSLIFMVAAVFSMLWIGANFNWNKKRTRKMAAIISGMLFLAGAVIQIAEMHTYTEITDTQIVVRKLWNIKTHQTEDIKSFHIYNENDAIQMELIFYDGSSVKMTGSSMETNDLYDQNYYSEYNYIAEYAQKLKESGADGSIRDIKKLRENVADLDSELREGLEQIIKIVPVAGTQKAQ